MTPHERILATLERRPTDRTPVDVWLTPEVLSDLQKHIGIQDELKLYQALGLDKIVWIFPGYKAEKYDPNESDGQDPWGVPMKKVVSGKAVYMEFGTPPLGEMEEPEELADYPLWPDPDKFNYAAAKAQAQKAREHGFATIGPWISFFEVYCHMRGVENQHILPFGTAEAVRKETETCLRTLGRNGGYIASSCHNIQAGSPVENVLAMIETVRKFQLT